MSHLQLYRDDLLNRFPGNTFTETVIGDFTKVEFFDSVPTLVFEAKKMSVSDAYQNIHHNLVGTFGEALPRLTITQRDALVDPADGMQFFETTTDEVQVHYQGGFETVGDVDHIVEINSWFNMSGIATKVFIPLVGSTSEDALGDDQRLFIPSNSGELLGLRVYSANDLASTVFTLENGDGGSVIGTQTVTVGNSGIVEIDFTTGLDSGVNTFDDSNPLVISIDPTNNADQVNIVAIFQIDN